MVLIMVLIKVFVNG